MGCRKLFLWVFGHDLMFLGIFQHNLSKVVALVRRLQGTGYQMFRDLPNEIIDRRKPQVATLKEGRKNGIPAAFSASQPDKSFVRGKIWPVGKPLVIQGRE